MLANPKNIPAHYIGYLLLAWLLTLPFGSYLAAVSIGFMTLYPSFVLVCILFVLTVGSFGKWSSFEKGFTMFIGVWFLAALVQSIAAKAVHADAVFDLKSLGIQLLVTVVIFGSRNRLTAAVFARHLRTGVFAYTVLLFATGAIEWFTTSHLAGKSTERLFELSAWNSMFRAPIFVFDNTNDFLLHLIFFFLFSLILSPGVRRKPFLVLAGWLVVYVFAIYADSRFASFIALSAIVLHSFYQLVPLFRKNDARKLLPYGISLLFLLIVMLINPLFIGPKYRNAPAYRLNDQVITQQDGHYVATPARELLTAAEQQKLIADLDSAVVNDPSGSQNLRKNLILNGVDFIRSAPFLGVGAGNYRYLTRTQEDLRFTGTIDSAHCFPIEAISQFGLFGWAYFIIFLIVVWRLFKRGYIKLKEMSWLLFLLLALPLLWCMPSSYLYLEVHRFLLPLLVCLPFLPVDEPAIAQTGKE